MKKSILIATLGSAGLVLMACDDAEQTTAATENADSAEADGGAYDSSSGTTAEPAELPAADDGDGARLSVGPDGAELDVEGEEADVSVDSEGPQLEADTGE